MTSFTSTADIAFESSRKEFLEQQNGIRTILKVKEYVLDALREETGTPNDIRHRGRGQMLMGGFGILSCIAILYAISFMGHVGMMGAIGLGIGAMLATIFPISVFLKGLTAYFETEESRIDNIKERTKNIVKKRIELYDGGIALHDSKGSTYRAYADIREIEILTSDANHVKIIFHIENSHGSHTYSGMDPTDAHDLAMTWLRHRNRMAAVS